MTTGRINQVTIPYQLGSTKSTDTYSGPCSPFSIRVFVTFQKGFDTLKPLSVFKKLSRLCTTRSSTNRPGLSLSPGSHNFQSRYSQSWDWDHWLKRGLPQTGHPEVSRFRCTPQIINCSQVWPQASNPQKFTSEYKRQESLYTPRLTSNTCTKLQTKP